MPHSIVLLFARYGYLVVFAAVLLENAGVPAPGHTVMLAGGALAEQGHLSIGILIAVGAFAAVVGDNIGYWIGRRGGRAFLVRHGHRFLITPERLTKIEHFFELHGPKAVFIGRFVTGLQTVAAIFAGASRMKWSKFFIYNLVGAIAWASAYGLAGYFFGASWDVLERWIGNAGLLLVGLIVVGVSLLLALRYRDRLGELIEAHVPAFLVSRGGLFGVAAVGAVALFAKIAEDVVNHESGKFDRVVSAAVHQFDNPLLDAMMRTLSFIGSFPVVISVVLALVYLCWRRGDRHGALVLAAVTAADEALNFGLKHVFARVRPDLFQEVATLHSYSFPSGHAMAAASIYGTAAIVAVRLAPKLRRSLAMMAPALIFLIGLSRIYLGAHWVTDVLAGFVAGAALMFAGVIWLEHLDAGDQEAKVSRYRAL